LFGGERAVGRGSHDNVGLEFTEIGGESRQPRSAAFRRPNIDDQIVSLNITKIAKILSEQVGCQ